MITEDGQLVGINTAVLKDAQGIGFAIPATVIEPEVGKLIIGDRPVLLTP